MGSALDSGQSAAEYTAIFSETLSATPPLLSLGRSKETTANKQIPFGRCCNHYLQEEWEEWKRNGVGSGETIAGRSAQKVYPG